MTVIMLRALIFYILLTLLMRFMGKRQIGEMQLTEFVTAILLSELAVLPVTDREIPLIHGLLPLLLIASLEVIISFICRKSASFRRMLNGDPIVLYEKNRYVEKNLTKARISAEEIEAEMRITGYESKTLVKTVILERTGKISVIPKSNTPASNQSGSD